MWDPIVVSHASGTVGNAFYGFQLNLTLTGSTHVINELERFLYDCNIRIDEKSSLVIKKIDILGNGGGTYTINCDGSFALSSVKDIGSNIGH